MKIADIMTPQPITVGMDTELLLIKEIFDQGFFHHLLVEDEGLVVGIISDRDLLHAISPYLDTRSETSRDAATLRKKAHQIMSRKIVSVTPDTERDVAARVLLDAHVSCLPVITPERQLVGIVTWHDFLSSYLAD